MVLMVYTEGLFFLERRAIVAFTTIRKYVS